MIYAYTKDGLKIPAKKGVSAFCDICGSEMVAKCGSIMSWHWAHRINNDQCETEGETEWHIWWKSVFAQEKTEVVIRKNGMVKRADAILSDGRVVEFQHSSISSEEISERESFYGSMIWVFDCRDSHILTRKPQKEIEASNGSIFGEWVDDDSYPKDYRTFRWKWPKKTIHACNQPVYLDFGDNVFRLKKFYPTPPAGGYGFIRPKSVLVDFFKSH